MVVTNFSNLTNTNTTLELLQVINSEYTNGFFVLLMLISFFIILFLNFDAGSSRASFVITAFIVGVMTNFMWLAGFVPAFIAIMSLILVFIAIAVYMIN